MRRTTENTHAMIERSRSVVHCVQRFVRRCVLPVGVAMWCAWMAALGFNWDGALDAAGNLPATAAVLAVIVTATCSPQVLGITLAFAVIGWQCQMLRGALWVSLWVVAGLAAASLARGYAWVARPPERDEGETSRCGREDTTGLLARILSSAGHCLYFPSGVVMNLLWSVPSCVTAPPRFLVLVYFELVSLVLVASAEALTALCLRCGWGGWEEKGELDKQGGEGRRSAIILVSASSNPALWLVPRLHFLSKSHLFGPILTFQSGCSRTDGIKEHAEKLRDFVLECEVLAPSQPIILVGHSVGGLICAYFADFVAENCKIAVKSVVCISTPWAGMGAGGGVLGTAHELLLAPVMIASHCLGSPFSPLQYSQKLRQDLEADSRVLVQIQDLQLQPVNSHKESRPRFYNLAGSLDVLTASSRHIAAKNAFWYCLLPHVGHSSILLSRTMWDQVFDWLRATCTMDVRVPRCVKSSSTHSSHIYEAPVCGQVDAPSMNLGHLAVGSANASTGAEARGGDCTHTWQRSACNLAIEGA